MAGCPPCKKGAPAWLLTFGDLMSLLLTFFILLVSMSTIDKTRFKEASGSLKDAFGVQQVQLINALPSGESLIATEYQQEIILIQLKEKLQIILSKTRDPGDAELIETDEGFLMPISNNALFLPGTTKLSPSAKTMLLQMANLINGTPNLIRVEGHTGVESDPKQFPSSWDQSATEAAAVVRFLVGEGEVNPTKLQVRGMGHYFPKASSADVDDLEKNHRVEILISREVTSGLK
ncbi:MAG: flagellar motor protein MotB [Magnetococcus sp. THC-1_WYH]